jgi:hypothetical protein
MPPHYLCALETKGVDKSTLPKILTKQSYEDNHHEFVLLLQKHCEESVTMLGSTCIQETWITKKDNSVFI